LERTYAVYDETFPNIQRIINSMLSYCTRKIFFILAPFPSLCRFYQRTFADIFTALIKRPPLSTPPCTLLLTVYYYT